MNQSKYSTLIGVTLGSDLNPLMKNKLIDFIINLEEKENADGCYCCAFEDTSEWEMPCAKCKRGSKDYWRPRGD